jgi:acyl carrier protein
MSVCTVETVVQIFHEKVGVPLSIPDIAQASWDDLGVESLGQAEVLATLENTIHVHVEFEHILSARNITEFVGVVNAIMAESIAR